MFLNEIALSKNEFQIKKEEEIYFVYKLVATFFKRTSTQCVVSIQKLLNMRKEFIELLEDIHKAFCSNSACCKPLITCKKIYMLNIFRSFTVPEGFIAYGYEYNIPELQKHDLQIRLYTC